ncbi:hypothetical protein [Actinacidiphila acididurans]|uniref:Uncharacterized protein n=1 Tax=Actinacidiphila acididurans TaxID=2784346 RepID=A0ABS2TV98_9ACTN|nr:hypothetical protein [Actinacidiphila acididurans]MBM9506737.1 hypothetical protein [Actinacidiphila acididurans]
MSEEGAAELHRGAAQDYRDGAAQRAPAAVRTADATTRSHAREATQANGAGSDMAEITPVAKDANATVEELQARARADYEQQRALEAARGKLQAQGDD